MGNATKRPSAYENDWRRRHPGLAADERRLRLDQAARDKAHGRRDKYRDGGTPETRWKARKASQGAIAQMVEKGHLTADQLGWACEIRRVVEQIGSDVAIGTVSLETRVDGGRRGDGTFFEKLGAVRAEVAYGHWRRSLGRRAGAVLAVVALDRSCRAAAREHRMRDATLRSLVAGALDAWPDHYRDARDAVSEADLLAAQAAIL